ncbi:porin PorA family protein [Nocardia salmonicida]|uniref:porin PorA family protein n=1 Tax=Nocardia salmonicida TaxID=53431 RepID=UPI002E2C32ED|nr:porin PorA family protein [Nocardia salmonicida]
MILIALSVLFVVLSVVTQFVIAPALTKLPSNLDSRVHYAGTGTLLDADALAKNDTAHILAKDVPVTIDRHVYVSRTSGDVAIAHDEVTLYAAGHAAEVDNHVYAIDRETMRTQTTLAGSVVEAASGLVFTLPLHPEMRDYDFYDPSTQSSIPAKYTGESNVNGRDTYLYALSAHGRLKNPKTLDSLPHALPKSVITEIMRLLPSENQRALGAAIDKLPNPVPLVYTVTTNVELSADKTLGTPLNSTLAKRIVASVAETDTAIPLLPVFDIKTALTPESVQRSVDTTNVQARRLLVISQAVPIGLAVLGQALVLTLAITGLGLRRRTTVAPRNRHFG